MAGAHLGKTIAKKIAGMSTGQKIAAGYAAFEFTTEYNRARREGMGAIGATAKAIVDSFMVNIIGIGPYAAMMAVQHGPALVVAKAEGLQRKAREMERASYAPFLGNSFVDTQASYTMRQAGMQMIQDSVLNTKKAMLGSEAQFLHR